MAEQDERRVMFLHDRSSATITQGETHAGDPAGRRAGAVAGPIGGAGGALGRRQVDAAAHRRVCWSSPTTARSISTAGDRRLCAMPSARRIRRTEIGFVYQSHHSAAGVLRAGERHDAAADPRPVRKPRRSKRAIETPDLSRPRASASRTARRSCPAASSSASPSRAPWPTRRAFCWPTSRPATSIRKTPSTCSRR